MKKTNQKEAALRTYGEQLPLKSAKDFLGGFSALYAISIAVDDIIHSISQNAAA